MYLNNYLKAAPERERYLHQQRRFIKKAWQFPDKTITGLVAQEGQRRIEAVKLRAPGTNKCSWT